MKPNPSQRRHYTLLGLVFLLFLLALVASSAALLPSLQADDEVDRLNRERLDALKEAICGNLDSDTAILSPVVSGYVADMGRLPLNLNELLVQGSQPSWTVDVQTSGKTQTPGNAYGWRGPYLSVIPDANGLTGAILPRFRDAWGTINSVPASDDANFGWSLPGSSSIATINAQGRGSLTLTSFGRDGASGGSGYDADLSTTITDSDYNVDISGLSVTFSFTELVQKQDYNSQLKGRTIRLAFVTAVNASMAMNNAAIYDLCSNSLNLGNGANNSNTTYTLSFSGNNSQGLTKRAPWGRRYLSLLVESNSGTLLSNIVPIAQADRALFLHPRGPAPGAETVVFYLP
jgi:hypothetical protein